MRTLPLVGKDAEDVGLVVDLGYGNTRFGLASEEQPTKLPNSRGKGGTLRHMIQRQKLDMFDLKWVRDSPLSVDRVPRAHQTVIAGYNTLLLLLLVVLRTTRLCTVCVVGRTSTRTKQLRWQWYTSHRSCSRAVALSTAQCA